MSHLHDLAVRAVAHDSAAISALFADAEWQEGGSDKPFPLVGDVAWLVDAGSVDVFAMVAPDRVEYRTHLVRVGAGQLLVGFDAAGDAGPGQLIGVGTRDARLRRLPRATLDARAGIDAGALGSLVAGWVELLCDAWQHERGPQKCAELDAGTAMSVSRPTAVRPRRDVLWVRHAEGHSRLLGLEGLEVNGTAYVPLSRRAWLQVEPPSRVLALETTELPDTRTLWEGLERLHAIILRFALIRHARTMAATAERLRRKDVGRRLALQSACASLVSTARPDDGDADDATSITSESLEPSAAWESALFVAARRVGRAMGVVMASPPPTNERPGSPADAVEAIARASRVRTRTVALRDEWWRHDNGSLLAFMGNERRPVALVPKDAHYRLCDPTRGVDTVLTEAMASEVQPFAHTFYRPFPDKPLGMLDVARCGLLGCGRDGAAVLGASLLAALIGLVPAVCTGAIFNSILPGAERSQLLQVSAILVACAVASALFALVRGIALLRIETRMSVTVQAAVWDRLLSLPMKFFRPYSSGDLAIRAMGIDAIRQVVSGSVITAILGGLFSLSNFALMFFYSSTMAWWATMLIAIAVLVTTAGSALQLRHQRGIAAMQTRLSGLVLQLLSSIAKLRVAGAEVTAFTLWARRFAEQRQLQFRARAIGNSVNAFNAAFPLLASMLLFWIALPLIHGTPAVMRTGDFLAFLSAYGACQGALLGTCAALLGTLNVVPLYEQARPILQASPEVNVSKSAPGTLTGDIEMQSVSFRYSADGPPILRGISLRVEPGEFVAFVGPSGSGKSTILRLLLGFETPESGAIYFDGQDLAGLDLQSVRRQIGVVLQSGRLTSGDIYSNIVGSAPLTIEDAWSAARMAGFADDVQAMPMGMHTVVSEGGGTLSGGQRQRLMIARALARQPRQLFLDEATSALDNRTQAIVGASLAGLRVTRLVVAHRLSTIVHADRIFVVERGQIVQTGRYDELMAQRGLFAVLARRQIA